MCANCIGNCLHVLMDVWHYSELGRKQCDQPGVDPRPTNAVVLVGLAQLTNNRLTILITKTEHPVNSIADSMAYSRTQKRSFRVESMHSDRRTKAACDFSAARPDRVMKVKEERDAWTKPTKGQSCKLYSPRHACVPD